MSLSFFVKLYGTFQRLNAPNSLQTETRKKYTGKLGATRYLPMKDCTFFDFFLQKTLRSNAHFISLYEKNGCESGVFLTENV